MTATLPASFDIDAFSLFVGAPSGGFRSRSRLPGGISFAGYAFAMALSLQRTIARQVRLPFVFSGGNVPPDHRYARRCLRDLPRTFVGGINQPQPVVEQEL